MAYRISTLPASPLLSRTICIPTRALIFSIPKETFLSASLRPRRDENRISCSSDEHGESRGLFEGFSVLPRDVPWNDSDVWSTMALYFFSLHIPLSFGGLDAICQLLNRTELDPLTEATSIFLLQISEVILASALLRYTLGSWDAISVVFQKEATTKRSLLKTSAAGLGVLISAVLLTSFLADQLLGPKEINNPMLREILVHDSTSKVLCFLVYCLVIPVLEEVVYRGFLLTYLGSIMKWQQALLISACVFSFAHLSFGNAPQLFFIGLVLGAVYCRTGNILSSIFVHSVYNAAILTMTSL